MSDRVSFIVPYPSRTVGEATLLVDNREVPIVVALRVVTSLRDRRPCWDGLFWSDRIPLDCNLDGRLTLRLPDGVQESIRVTSSSRSAPVEGDRWGQVRAEFLSERNFKE